MRLRNGLYGLARVLGDINAIRRGRLGRRLVNKLLGRHVVRRIWR